MAHAVMRRPFRVYVDPCRQRPPSWARSRVNCAPHSMQALSALCTGAALGAVGTYQMYHAVWKSRDFVAERSLVYVQQHDPTGRQVRLSPGDCSRV